MKRFIHNGSPSATQWNQAIQGVDALNSMMIPSLAGGTPSPVIFKALAGVPVYQPDDYAVRHDFPNPAGYNDAFGYVRLKGKTPVIGMTFGAMMDAYTRAGEMRQAQREIGNQYDFDYGWFSWEDIDASDLTYGTVGNPVGLVRGKSETGGSIQYWFGSSAYGNENRAIFPDNNNKDMAVANHENEMQNVYSSITGGCPVPEQWNGGLGYWVKNYIDAFWLNDNGWVLVIEGVGFNGGVAGNYAYYDHPKYVSNFNGIFAPTGWGNYIGGAELTAQMGGYGAPAPFAVISCTSSTGFAFPQEIQWMPQGSTILEAKLEIKIPSITRYDGSYSATYSREGGLVETGTVVDTSRDIGIAVIAGKVTDSELLTMQWDILGAVASAGTIENDVWQVVDATGFFNTLLAYQDSDYTRFSIAPTPYLDSFNQENQSRGMLRSMMPNITYSVDVHPDNDTLWHDGSVANGGLADVVYISSASSSWVTWDNVQLGKAYIKFQLPDCSTRQMQVSFLPRMD